MYVKKCGEKFPSDCIGKVFTCVRSNASMYKVGHNYKVYDYEGWTVVLEDLTEKHPIEWNGTSAEFVEVLPEEQLCFNFS